VLASRVPLTICIACTRRAFVIDSMTCYGALEIVRVIIITRSRNQYTPEKQESWAIAKMTARCALCMCALKNFQESHMTTPWLRFSKFIMGFCSEWDFKCACKIWSS